jgi:hypothetical protein
MTHYKKILLTSIITLNLISCGKNKTENDLDSNPEPQGQNDTSGISTSPKNDTTETNNVTIESETKGSVLSESKFTRNPDEPVENTTEVISENKAPSTPTKNSTNSSTTNTTTKKVSAPSNYTIQKILNGCKLGETLSQDDLSKHLEIPKDAIKLVKSIKKISADEIDVKWNSTWAVEKLSDAKFKDGVIKARFVNNSVYISGGAIGIKYDRKIYTDLVVTGRKAHIPTVKGYYWKIGRD